jgi:hypothetical protein
MVQRLGAALAALALTVGGSTAVQSAVDPADLCKDKKGKAAGKAALDLLKAYGKNSKTPNGMKLASDLSKAQSKFSKGFTKAEFASSGASQGCLTLADAELIGGQLGEAVGKIVANLKVGPQAPGVLGPQAPRDIANWIMGTNVVQPPVDAANQYHLCNVHFHNPAEHAGYQACANTPRDGLLGVCPGGTNKNRVGDEIEFHWVYTSCAPGERLATTSAKNLEHCLCKRPTAANPGDYSLLVTARVYVIVPDPALPALPVEPTAFLPANTYPGGPLPAGLTIYPGSTTGHDYGSGTPLFPKPHSPFKVWWAVDPVCAQLHKGGLQTWCDNVAMNEFPQTKDKHDHDIRPLVTNPAWLSP